MVTRLGDFRMPVLFVGLVWLELNERVWTRSIYAFNKTINVFLSHINLFIWLI